MKIMQFLMLSVLVPNISWAIVNECSITPAIWQLSPVPKIIANNNLNRATGSSEFAQGTVIEISGTVFDQNCVPVTGATVEIWQANSKGGFDFNTNELSALKDPNFAGTGKAITDNKGFYNFRTIMPGSQKENRAPNISFRVTHKDFLPLETVMYFENNSLNDTDSLLLKEVALNKRNLLVAKPQNYINNETEENIKYRFDITFEGNNKYKNY